jgi:catechol 2,3-dioxygenase-like lactoylglutathione lyase family enzyme
VSPDKVYSMSLLDHVNIQTCKIEETIRFYEQVVGLRKGFRPAFNFPGAWMYIGDQAVLHLIGLTDSRLLLTGSGCVNHVAFNASGLSELIGRLDAAGIPFDVSDVPGQQLRQVFFFDPNGLKVEIAFTGSDCASELPKARLPQPAV